MNTKQTIIFRCGTSKWKTKQKKKRSQYKPDQQESTTWWAALIPFLLQLIVKLLVLICLSVLRVCMFIFLHAWICVSLQNMARFIVVFQLPSYVLRLQSAMMSSSQIDPTNTQCAHDGKIIFALFYCLQWMSGASYDTWNFGPLFHLCQAVSFCNFCSFLNCHLETGII
jgi:hypothetical protein